MSSSSGSGMRDGSRLHAGSIPGHFRVLKHWSLFMPNVSQRRAFTPETEETLSLLSAEPRQHLSTPEAAPLDPVGAAQAGWPSARCRSERNRFWLTNRDFFIIQSVYTKHIFNAG